MDNSFTCYRIIQQTMCYTDQKLSLVTTRTTVLRVRGLSIPKMVQGPRVPKMVQGPRF